MLRAMSNLSSFGLTDVSARTGGGCGCGCGGHGATDEASAPAETNATQVFSVSGMTCGHCANAVTEELSALQGVSSVEVDLVAGGTSTVRVVADRDLSTDEVTGALDEAGDYALV